jgi:hypothetical protein
MQMKSLIPQMWAVPQELRDRLGERPGRQRTMFCEGHLLLVLHAPPSPDDKPQARRRGARLFWRAPDGSWQSDALGGGAQALRRHIADYEEWIQKLELDKEDAERADDFELLLRRIAPLRRSSRNLHSALQEARELVREERELVICRDQAYAVERAFELLHGDTQNALECAIARRAEEQAEISQRLAQSSHRLNALAAVFFPLATVAALAGMQLPTGFEGALPAPAPFWLTLGGGLLAGWLLKKRLARH